VCPRDHHFVDTRGDVEQEAVSGRTHQGALHQRLAEPQPPTANWAFPPKGHASTVPNARYARVINEGYQTITSGSWTWIAQPGNVVGTRSVHQPPVAHRTEEEGMS